jgi:hypothetical protein
MYEKKPPQNQPELRVNINKDKPIQNVYWGVVRSVYDPTEGGRIKVYIPKLDVTTLPENLPWADPMLPKFFHLYPKKDEVVRVFIGDSTKPQSQRFWMGSVISQLQKVEEETLYTALATSDINFTAPERAISTYPDAKGVFPEQEDIGIIGRDNTDIILRVRDVEIRAGKNENENVFVLNKTNPASIRATYDVTGDTTISSSMIMADKIGLIAHEGIPKFKAAEITQEDRQNIFSQSHPLGRGDVIVEALELLRKALVQHIHPYSGVPADKSGILIDLEKADFTQILQKNIVIN